LYHRFCRLCNCLSNRGLEIVYPLCLDLGSGKFFLSRDECFSIASLMCCFELLLGLFNLVGDYLLGLLKQCLLALPEAALKTFVLLYEVLGEA